MSIVTESQLKAYRNATRKFSINLSESLDQFRSESKNYRKSIFLSHKHDELELLDGTIAFLKSQGIDVYVDWLDGGMPKQTSAATAVRIKEKIKGNDKFILLASEGAISSKWCNWELGLGDAEKYINGIAILPVAKDGIRFSGAEYLKIYPYIEHQSGGNKYSDETIIPRGYYVRFPTVNGKYIIIPLKKWLNS